MSRFEKFKEHLLNSFVRLNEILEIELRDEFSIIDIEDKRSFIVVDQNLEDIANSRLVRYSIKEKRESFSDINQHESIFNRLARKNNQAF
jgi:hypothetical protein